MAKVVLASALARWLPDNAAPASKEIVLDLDGDRLDRVLEALFVRFPNLRGYVLDELGGVRHHVAIFIDGSAITDKVHPVQPVATGSEIYVMQALSGG